MSASQMNRPAVPMSIISSIPYFRISPVMICSDAPKKYPPTLNTAAQKKALIIFRITNRGTAMPLTPITKGATMRIPYIKRKPTTARF